MDMYCSNTPSEPWPPSPRNSHRGGRDSQPITADTSAFNWDVEPSQLGKDEFDLDGGGAILNIAKTDGMVIKERTEQQKCLKCGRCLVPFRVSIRYLSEDSVLCSAITAASEVGSKNRHATEFIAGM